MASCLLWEYRQEEMMASVVLGGDTRGKVDVPEDEVLKVLRIKAGVFDGKEVHFI